MTVSRRVSLRGDPDLDALLTELTAARARKLERELVEPRMNTALADNPNGAIHFDRQWPR